MGKPFTLIILAAIAFFIFNTVDAATIKQAMEGGIDVTITHPDSVIAGRDFAISVLVQNNGWEDKQDISLFVTTRDDAITTKNGTLSVARLSKDGSYGGTIDFSSSVATKPSTYYLNALYSHVLLSNNEVPMPQFQKNIAIPIEIKEQPEVQINTIIPTAIFPNAEFAFDVEILSKDIELRDVSVEIVAPEDIRFRGQAVHSFSSIQKNTPIMIRSQIVTEPTDIATEHKLPFEVVVHYTDDTGTEKTTSKTMSLLLRPRTFMELTSDGGIWIGSVFLAPYVSIGTIVGIPAGTLFSILIHRMVKKKSTKKKKAR